MQVPKVLQVGACVEAFGLTGAMHLNGRHGIAECFDERTQRYGVKFDGSEKLKALKAENLRLAGPNMEADIQLVDGKGHATRQAAATKLQALWRAGLVRCYVPVRRENFFRKTKEAAALKLQVWWRSVLVEREVSRQHMAAAVIQGWWRDFDDVQFGQPSVSAQGDFGRDMFEEIQSSFGQSLDGFSDRSVVTSEDDGSASLEHNLMAEYSGLLDEHEFSCEDDEFHVGVHGGSLAAQEARFLRDQ